MSNAEELAKYKKLLDDRVITQEDFDKKKEQLLNNNESTGLTTDNSGTSIVVPPSHMITRVLANNDNLSYPWFAPSGTRRTISLLRSRTSGFSFFSCIIMENIIIN